MATSINSTPLAQFKCNSCNAIPTDEQVKKCTRGHTFCLKCSARNVPCMKCKSSNLVMIPNPLVQIVETTVKKECIYKDGGCTWMITNDMDDHHSECKFRPYECVGTEMGIWNCNWTGIQQNFAAHMAEKHQNNGEFFTHWQSGVLDFNPNQTCKKFNLIDAFNKKFVFMYVSHVKNPNVVIIIYLLGRKSDAQKFMIDFELRDGLRKVKSIEDCFCDAHDIKKIITEHRCLVLPKKLLESYAKDGKLEFRYVMKKKDGIELENVEKQQHLLHNVLHGPRQQFHPKPQMKAYQSESNLILTPQQPNTNGQPNRKPIYRRAPKI